LCASHLRDLRRAQDEMRRVVTLLPNRAVFRDNLALYANYAGDFKTAEEQARAVQGADAYASLALAFAQTGQGQVPQAIETYRKLATLNALGASFAASGLGDLATHEGRFADAVRILGQGASDDLAAKNPDRAAAKYAAMAYAELSRGQNRSALQFVGKALANSNDVTIRFLAARSFIDAGEFDKAAPISASLASELQAEPQAYGKILDGLVALRKKNARQAIKALLEANTLLDMWIGRFDLGRAYLEAGQFPQADSEFDRCLKRRGEAISLFLDEEPTYAYFPSVYYYQGRVRQGLQTAGFADSYRAYMSIRGKSTEDPLLPDIRRNLPQ
jgi:tetratricopeptide (TPR) repeat protein